ncbi:MAG TPA: hypothetical protein VFN50_09965 [Acidimicrobiales bacterium]|nr:hypothetical protein [Acidimicrobiales bacterium]
MVGEIVFALFALAMVVLAVFVVRFAVKLNRTRPDKGGTRR